MYDYDITVVVLYAVDIRVDHGVGCVYACVCRRWLCSYACLVGMLSFISTNVLVLMLRLFRLFAFYCVAVGVPVVVAGVVVYVRDGVDVVERVGLYVAAFVLLSVLCCVCRCRAWRWCVLLWLYGWRLLCCWCI